MCHKHRLRMLKVSAARHDGVDMGVGRRGDRINELHDERGDVGRMIKQVQPHQCGNLIVSAAASAQLSAEFRAKGYATEGVTGLLHWGSAQGAKGFEAEALLENAASRRVLAKCGFREVGPGREPGHTRYRRPAIDPEADETGQA